MVPPAAAGNNKSLGVRVDLSLDHTLSCLPPGGQVRVIRVSVQSFRQFTGELKEPASTVVVEVDRAGIVKERCIELHDPTRERGVQSGGGLLRFDEADFLLCSDKTRFDPPFEEVNVLHEPHRV